MTTVKPDGNHAMRGFFGRDLIYVLLWLLLPQEP